MAAMKRAVYTGLICAVIGYAIAVVVGRIPPSTSIPIWMQAAIAYILCPPAILAGLTATDPDINSLLFFFGPLNAFIYGVVGLTFSLWRTNRSTGA